MAVIVFDKFSGIDSDKSEYGTISKLHFKIASSRNARLCVEFDVIISICVWLNSIDCVVGRKRNESSAICYMTVPFHRFDLVVIHCVKPIQNKLVELLCQAGFFPFLKSSLQINSSTVSIILINKWRATMWMTLSHLFPFE